MRKVNDGLTNSQRYRLRHPNRIKENRKKSDRKYKVTHRELVRKHHQKYWERNPKRKRAHAISQHIPLASKCELCPNTENLERHHPNYDYPHIFVTVCRECHNWITKDDRAIMRGTTKTKKK